MGKHHGRCLSAPRSLKRNEIGASHKRMEVHADDFEIGIDKRIYSSTAAMETCSCNYSANAAASGRLSSPLPRIQDSSTSYSNSRASNALRTSSRSANANRYRCHVTDPALMQDVIMGGAVVRMGGAAVINGIKNDDPEICPSCAGSGGVRCFACDATGKMTGLGLEELGKARSAAGRGSGRDAFGRRNSVSNRECIACKGAGMLFCKRCSGSGYTTLSK